MLCIDEFETNCFLADSIAVRGAEMSRAVTCTFEGRVISIENALVLRVGIPVGERKSLFKCIECGKDVRPHKSGGSISAHFEHLRRNNKCNLSDPRTC